MPKTIRQPVDLGDYYHDDRNLWEVVLVDLQSCTAELHSSWTDEDGKPYLVRTFTFEELEALHFLRACSPTQR